MGSAASEPDQVGPTWALSVVTVPASVATKAARIGIRNHGRVGGVFGLAAR